MSSALGPFEGEGVNFNFKAPPSADRVGVEEGAVLTRAACQPRISPNLAGSGSVGLGGPVHAPLRQLVVNPAVRGAVHRPRGELVVISAGVASAVRAAVIAACKPVAATTEVVFLPYHSGRHDDWSALDTESAAVAPVT